jgi:hypothetical protein
MNTDYVDYNEGYDKGFAEGLKASDFSEAYWLHSFAGQAMQGLTVCLGDQPHRIARLAAEQAQALFAEVKKCEANND